MESNSSRVQLVDDDAAWSPLQSQSSTTTTSEFVMLPPHDVVRIRKPGAWRRCSFLETALIGIVVALLLLLTLVILYSFPRHTYVYPITPSSAHGTVCTTAACVQAAANLLSSVNEEVDPCDDFYDYACSKWVNEHSIPDDQTSHGTFQEVRIKVDIQMRKLLEARDGETSTAIRKTRMLYEKCTDRVTIDSYKSRPMLDMLANIGPWPVLQHGDYQMNASWTLHDSMISATRVMGAASLYQTQVHADAGNTSRSIMNLDQAQLLLGSGAREYYMNDTLYANQMHTVKLYMRDVLRIIIGDLNVTTNEERLWQDVSDMMVFEKRLAAILTPQDERREPTNQYHLLTIQRMSELCPSIEWLELFRAQGTAEVSSYWSLSTEINVAEPAYLSRLHNLLLESSPRTVINYLMWVMSHQLTRHLDSRYDRARQEFARGMFGNQRMSSRWVDCTHRSNGLMKYAAGSLYVRHYFDAQDKEAALVMIAHLREAFKEIVDDLDWMDDDTKEKARVKVDAIRNHIGYPDFIVNDTLLDGHYEQLNFTKEKTYFEFFMAYCKWAREQEYRQLHEGYDKDEFETSPAEVNAFYSPEKNAITFPAGILQAPFFNRGYPASINYGAIGAVIGHEITHGFDDQGSHFDAQGNMRNWWSTSARHAFVERKACIVDQYHNYVMPTINMSINGILTQGENIADNGGVKEAFKAYRQYVEQLGHEEALLPGFTHLTHNKLFFISYAHFWCSKKRPSFAVSQVMRDEHAPERFRVIGVLSNIDEFAREFKCPVGSAMNPKNKCTVW